MIMIKSIETPISELSVINNDDDDDDDHRRRPKWSGKYRSEWVMMTHWVIQSGTETDKRGF